MKFNEKLLSLRKEKGYSQEILADKLNVSRQTISKWESGITTPELEKIILLSEIFNISIDELIGKEKPDKPEKNEEDNKLNFKKFKNKIIKNIIITLFIILIVSLFSFILYRYLIVDTIYKRILYCEPKKNEFCYTKQILKYENNIAKKWIIERTFVKDKVFKTEYYDTDIQPNKANTKPSLRKIVYGDKNGYYTIDIENKSYTKEHFENYEFYTNQNFSNLTYELQGAINGEFNLQKLKNRILLSLDFNNIIKIDKESEEKYNSYVLGRNNIDNFIGLPQSVSVIKDLNNPIIFFNKTVVDEKNKSNFIMYIYDKVYEDIAEEDIMLPDLSEYNLINMPS